MKINRSIFRAYIKPEEVNALKNIIKTDIDNIRHVMSTAGWTSLSIFIHEKIGV